jgi:hypothetical protein
MSRGFSHIGGRTIGVESVSKKMRAENQHGRRKTMDIWWLMVDGWWLMVDGWWLMVDGWWLMVDGWWLMVDGWWSGSSDVDFEAGPGAAMRETSRGQAPIAGWTFSRHEQ